MSITALSTDFMASFMDMAPELLRVISTPLPSIISNRLTTFTVLSTEVIIFLHKDITGLRLTSTAHTSVMIFQPTMLLVITRHLMPLEAFITKHYIFMVRRRKKLMQKRRPLFIRFSRLLLSTRTRMLSLMKPST